jgi:Flp pilus assembly protein CpaB
MQDLFAGRLFKTRGSALLIGGIAAVVAAILLVAYLSSYRSSVNSSSRPMPVLVAKKLIPRGTSGTVVAQEGLYQATTVPKNQLKDAAIADPAAINDRVTATDIYPGQQLTQDDFSTESSGAVTALISGAQRAISVPVDAAHGLIGQVNAGDHVDVYVGLSQQTTTPVMKLLASNILVLVPPSSGSSDAVLRVSGAQAAKFAYSVDNARLWLVLRPQLGATPTPPTSITAASLGVTK